MYDIHAYGVMINDETRTDAYVAALRQSVKPGSVVLDIGTGTGFFALLACQFGARKVYAVEPNDAIDVARRIAAANGYDDTIEFMQGISTEISLPEPVDVVVSDLRGVLPYFGRNIKSIIDARQRLLAPGGRLIPGSDNLWLACVEAPELHRKLTTPWAVNRYGLDMRAARELQANNWGRAEVEIQSRQLMTQPVKCASIDYFAVENCSLDARSRLCATRAGTAHGFCVWFDSILAEGIHLSNSPGRPQLVYGQAFFPWPQPVSMSEGDTVVVRLKSDPIEGDYTWSWETSVFRKDHFQEPAHHFRQSDFFAQPLSVERLHRQSADHIPSLNRDGQIDLLILGMMGESHPLGEIAHRLMALHPERFTRWEDALSRAAGLSGRYSG